MKTLNQKIALVLATIIFSSSFSALAHEGQKNDSTAAVTVMFYEEEMMSETEFSEILFELEDDESNWLDDVITYNIYDADDNLVLSTAVNRTAPLQNKELVKYMAKSDLLMTYNNSSYYRLTE